MLVEIIYCKFNVLFVINKNNSQDCNRNFCYKYFCFNKIKK
jgi:hypothetical protein